jgi:hypothetical protein
VLKIKFFLPRYFGRVAWLLGGQVGFADSFPPFWESEMNQRIQYLVPRQPPEPCLQDAMMFFLKSSKTSKIAKARVKNLCP